MCMNDLSPALSASYDPVCTYQMLQQNRFGSSSIESIIAKATRMRIAKVLYSGNTFVARYRFAHRHRTYAVLVDTPFLITTNHVDGQTSTKIQLGMQLSTNDKPACLVFSAPDTCRLSSKRTTKLVHCPTKSAWLYVSKEH